MVGTQQSTNIGLVSRGPKTAESAEKSFLAQSPEGFHANTQSCFLVKLCPRYERLKIHTHDHSSLDHITCVFFKLPWEEVSAMQTHILSFLISTLSLNFFFSLLTWQAMNWLEGDKWFNANHFHGTVLALFSSHDGNGEGFQFLLMAAFIFHLGF